jgi:filamentous hemagglutinin
VTQKAAVGGELAIQSSGAVVQRSGATLDASGGGFRYGEGVAAVSQLLGGDGKVYSISSAPEQRTYIQLLDTYTRKDGRYNLEQVYTGLTYGIGTTEAAYVEGKAGGSIAINAGAGLVLDGKLLGGVTVGPNQLAAAPRGANLTLGGFWKTNSTPRNASATCASWPAPVTRWARPSQPVRRSPSSSATRSS